MSESGLVKNGPMDRFNREADGICATLVSEIDRTTVWVEIVSVANALRHVRRQQKQHNAEQKHLSQGNTTEGL